MSRFSLNSIKAILVFLLRRNSPFPFF